MHHVMGVCCIVFDIDGMLLAFFINFLNIEKMDHHKKLHYAMKLVSTSVLVNKIKKVLQ